MASIQCPHCGAKLNVPEAALGKNGRCPKCQNKFLLQVAKPADEYDLAPLDAAAMSLLQPLPPVTKPAGPGPAMATPSQSLLRPISQDQKKPGAASTSTGLSRQKMALLVGGGILCLLLFAVVGGLLMTFVRNGNGAGGGASWSGQYAVVDSMPSLPPEPAEGPAPPLDTEPARQAEWSVQPDAATGEETSASLVGALSPQPSLLLASLNGNYAVGVTLGQEPIRRNKVLKRADGTPGEVVSIDAEPHPVLDIRTGKSVGVFPAEARIRFNCRLSPDGRYLVSSVFEASKETQRVLKDELVVWQRDSNQPICRWPLPGPVLWADFIAPERLALYHVTPSPQFVVLDVTKGTPVVTASLPADEFPDTHDAFSTHKVLTSYRVWTSSGAVSPGGKWVALGGNKNIILVDAAGKLAGKLPIDPVKGVRHYQGVSFNKDGTQLRALILQAAETRELRVWSLASGKVLHKKPCPFQLRDGENPYHESAPGPAILDGPNPNTLLVGHLLFDVASAQKIAELPYQPLRWAGPMQLLALGRTDQATNAAELVETADFVPHGKSLIVAAFDGATLLASAPKPPVDPLARPTPAAADRSKVTVVRLQPPAAWAVKPGVEPSRPAGPLPLWPQAFATTEAAAVSQSLIWTRYDLNSGSPIGEPIDLWPDQPAPAGPLGWNSIALMPDGQKLALVDAKDPSRVDVWDSTGKRLIGLHPYEDAPILWVGWSSHGKLLTGDSQHLSSWDVDSGQATFEVEGNFRWFVTSPGAEWVLVTTPARHLFFVDSATGQALGHIPANPSFPEYSLSPDGKTLLRLGQMNLQVWDLQSGNRLADRETPLVPLSQTIGGPQMSGVGVPMLGVFWVGKRSILSHTSRPGEQQPRYYLYDLDLHTHTYSYAASLGTFKNDSLGRAWVNSMVGGAETWIAPNIPGVGTFDKTLAFGPGTTIRVEVDVGARERSKKTAENMAAALAAQGFKLGPDGWLLRADHKINTTSTDLTDHLGRRGISVATLNINWQLLDPAGNEVWKATAGGKFDPFTSKYVVVGSRKTDMAAGGLGGGSTQVNLDYQGKDAMTAQVEEILEKYWYPGLPTFLVKSENGYSPLPLPAPGDAAAPANAAAPSAPK